MHPKSQMLLKVHIFKRRSRRIKEGTSPEFDKKLRKIERTAKALIVAELRQTYPLKYLLNLKDYKRRLNHSGLPEKTFFDNEKCLFGILSKNVLILYNNFNILHIYGKIKNLLKYFDLYGIIYIYGIV